MQAPRLANGTEKQTDWNAVNWRKANRTVRNLRQRIFRAAQEGNLKKVRSLQKLMLKSYSNRLVSVRRVAQIKAGREQEAVLFVMCSSCVRPEAHAQFQGEGVAAMR